MRLQTRDGDEWVGGDGAPKRPVSGKQLEANRLNANKSTGPKTPAGKKASSKNSFKHGVFAATGIEPVEDGTYAEDPDELRDDVASLIDGLEPRDAIEVELATRLVGVMIRLRRLGRWSALRIADESTVTRHDLEIGARSEYKALALFQAAELLSRYLGSGGVSDETDFEVLSLLIRYHGPSPKVGVKDLWTDEREPETPEEWSQVFQTLLAHHWPKRADAEAWSADLAKQLSDEYDRVRDMEARNAARRILDGPFELETKYESRLSHDLKKYWGLYRELQARELPEET